MRWEDERYVRVYTRDTPDWLALGWEAQALLMLTLRKVDRAGMLDLGKAGPRGLAALVGMPAEVVEPALQTLLRDGCAAMSGSVLVFPNFIEAQETPQSDRQRKAESRAKARDRARLESQNVTESENRSQIVTPQNQSQNVTADRTQVTNRDQSVTFRDRSVTSPDKTSHAVTRRHTVSPCTVPCRTVPLKEEDLPAQILPAQATQEQLSCQPEGSKQEIGFRLSRDLTTEELANLGISDPNTRGDR